MQHQQSYSTLFTAIFTGVTGTLIYLLSLADLITFRVSFVLLTLVMLSYLGVEIKRVKNTHPLRWMINPAVVCSLMTFTLSFGLTNLLYFLPESQLSYIGVLPEVTVSMNKLMWLVLIGALAMWLGYWSSLSTRLVKKCVAKFQPQVLKYSAQPKAMVLPALVLISLASRLLQIKLGIFGYSSTYDNLIGAASYSQYLSMAASLGKMALVIVSLRYFSENPTPKSKLSFFVIFAYELFFGFMSGMKSAVVLPFIIVLICRYLRVGFISKGWLISILVAIVFAYAVIEPFRELRNQDTQFKGTSLTGIVSTLITSTATKKSSSGVGSDDPSLLVTVLGRTNLSYIGSLGIDFVDYYGALPSGSPDFLPDIFLAPIHAWVPRFIWQEKSLGNAGLWYTQTIIGRESNSSTAMGIFTNLYFAGGVIMVFFRYVFYGCD